MPRVPNLRQISNLSSGFGGSLGGKFGVTVRGSTPLLNKFRKLAKDAPNHALDGITRALLIVESETVRLITHGYYRPAIDTGRLRRSITHAITLFSPNVIEGVVGTNVYYAFYVHEGTKFMEKRPFLIDAIDNKKWVVRAILKEAYRANFVKVSETL